MRAWRPAYKCIYVIPEIHGAIDLLNIIVNRIFPLRFSIGQEDVVVFLGDYIDCGANSKEVVDVLIKLKQEYTDQVFFIKGNHEQDLINALGSDEAYRKWLLSGGQATISSYTNNSYVPFSRLSDIIPSSHINFIKSLPNYFDLEDYLFFHGGIDIQTLDTSTDRLLYDMSYSRQIKQMIKNKTAIDINQKILVSAHNFKAKKPFIYSKCFMLGGSAPAKLVLFELNSMSCAMVKTGKTRIYKHNFKYFE